MTTRLRTLGFTVLGLGLSVAAVEVVLGTLFWLRGEPGTVILRDRIEDAPYVYYRFKPDPEEGINEDGLYTSLPREKDGKKFRVALIGGSVAKNIGRAREATGELVLESALNRAVGTTKIELLDAATSGYVSQQELVHLQLVVQHYEPDMIVALDGFNDLMTLLLNGGDEALADLPPHHWRAFRVIETNKAARSFRARFSPLFRSTRRALDLASRLASGAGSDDASDISPKAAGAFVDSYLAVIADTRDYARAKGMDYFGFLQPIRFYDPENGDGFTRGDDDVEALTAAYHDIDLAYERAPYLASLSRTMDDHLEHYRDNCHVTLDGHRVVSSAIADALAERISSHPSFTALRQ